MTDETPAAKRRLPPCAGEAHRTLLQRFEQETVAGEVIARRREAIRTQVLAQSDKLDTANFTQIATTDVAAMVEQVDDVWFDGGVRRCIAERQARLLTTISSRMTSTGGKTLLGHLPSGTWRFEIRLAVTPLFRTFREEEPSVERDILVNGVVCHDRLGAALAIIEHELMHVAELLCYSDSACHAPRFQEAARRLFGHASHQHQLVSGLERAAVTFGITPGSRVAFECEGERCEGVVARIVKRATVLVPDPQHGQRYSDGNYYRKYYVPLSALTPLD